ncbi:carboxyl transferase domain-containing protein [Pimelobacter simplex]|uniref:carboxyl transferase domain-containing protein n=1 Tax=Nocardioides simplex TaxID=2045 RepID=UPI00214FB17D|nr:carboxyl transferase domain-containing protein [Pimelobacter simplex]UUW92532.1 hypothetical protein M0M43_13915 [Pimelobacter simplex]UUW96360.1 hypothetical protein M0M48_02550 [Pimelobacter simplex]
MTATDVARPSRSSVVDLVGGLLDAPLASWDTAAATPPAHADTLGYRKALREASERAGTDESVVTGEGLIQGRRIAVIANEFTFLAGSIGLASATRIVEAVERATAEQLPLVAIASSGGTRMQEGTMAFLAMPGIAAAVAEHKAAGLPYIAYLRHPTTGGVLASWGSLGTVKWSPAEWCTTDLSERVPPT